MKRSIAGLLALATGLGLPALAAAKPVEVLVQMTNYEGENAYLVIYLVDADGRYARTLWVSGTETIYYADMPRWWKYLARQPQDLDAITGASAAKGDRNTFTVEIDDAMLAGGHTLRIETSVEAKATYPEDATVPLTPETVGQRIDGTGYIRFVRVSY